MSSLHIVNIVVIFFYDDFFRTKGGLANNAECSGCVTFGVQRARLFNLLRMLYFNRIWCKPIL